MGPRPRNGDPATKEHGRVTQRMGRIGDRTPQGHCPGPRRATRKVIARAGEHWQTRFASGVSLRMALKTAPVVETITEDDVELDPGKHAHIVVTKPGETATAVVLEARIMGTPVEALCGHVFVPQRDPLQLPICPKCKEIYDLMRMMNEHLHETPGS